MDDARKVGVSPGEKMVPRMTGVSLGENMVARMTGVPRART